MTFLPILLALLPLAIWAAVLSRPGHLFSSRSVPADVARVAVVTSFVCWVNPWWGVCAALSMGHWMFHGYRRSEGAWLWPTLAMAAALGITAPASALQVAVGIALCLGVFEVLLAVLQWQGYCLGQPIHGTIGHRTGLGMYLAILMPLAFLTPYAWILVPIYLAGLFVSKSAVAWAAMTAGLLVVSSSHAYWLIPVAAVGIGFRAVTYGSGRFWHIHLGDSFNARWRLWKVTLFHTRRWPYWLIGHGANTWSTESRQWVGRFALREVYAEAHNEYVEHVYEYGVVGSAAMVGFAVSLAPAMHRADPWTGSLAALLVGCVAQFPLKVAPILGLVGLVVIHFMRAIL